MPLLGYASLVASNVVIKYRKEFCCAFVLSILENIKDGGDSYLPRYFAKPSKKQSVLFPPITLANVDNANALYAKLIEEFERCILSYFAFHWNRASFIITQVLSSQSQPKINLKNILLEATREHRFEIITKKLKVARVFSILVEEIKAIKGDSQSCDDKVSIVQSERSPVLLLMGGGMGSGKSIVLKDILRESFWSEAASNVVVVEADAFKESDVIYRALKSTGHHDEMLQSAELVHQTSTDAASSLLVTTLNKGRNVIMDSTLAWEPFLEKTIAMARNVHKNRCLR
ncbi:unnamed protein product [Vicia faba]|uniref:Zeta toxin domain-containing protein n=1 Tax=Vicia faba TaxID=3906 RepID=A0AAV1BBJ0_VICFA|nr:unnamed protein product [Vicia faba]